MSTAVPLPEPLPATAPLTPAVVRGWQARRAEVDRRLAPDTPLATKPQLARHMLARVLEAGPPVAWVTGDTVYGRSRALRSWLEDEGLHHVLAVPRNDELWAGHDLWRVDEVQAVHAHREWYRISAGAGSKGERWYDWQCWVLAEPEDAARGHYLLLRRSLANPDNWQAYVAFAPQDCDLMLLVAVAGRRWCIEHAFESAKQETGLDDYEVRSARLVPARDPGPLSPGPAGRGASRGPGASRPPKKSPGPPSLRAFRRSRGLAGG